MTDDEEIIIDVEEDVETEEIEFEMTESEIDEWISELTRLKEEKNSAELFIDEGLSLKVNYLEDDEGEEDE